MNPIPNSQQSQFNPLLLSSPQVQPYSGIVAINGQGSELAIGSINESNLLTSRVDKESATLTVLSSSIFDKLPDSRLTFAIPSGVQFESTLTPSNFVASIDDYSSPFTPSILDGYDTIKSYEKEYGIKSSDLLKDWQEGTLRIGNSDVNDWLGTYLQIKDFIDD